MTPTATPVTYRDATALARFSVARYQRMVELGILTSSDKVELLEEWIVTRQSRTPLHDSTLMRMRPELWDLPPPGWCIRILSSIELPDSQPEPDFAIVRGGARTYMTRHPTAADTGQLIEVADWTLVRDQRDKTRIYARAAIPWYWIVNLVDLRIEVYSQPSGPTAVPAYASFQIYQPGDAVPLILDGNLVGTVPASALLP